MALGLYFQPFSLTTKMSAQKSLISSVLEALVVVVVVVDDEDEPYVLASIPKTDMFHVIEPVLSNLAVVPGPVPCTTNNLIPIRIGRIPLDGYLRRS
jgi:hypothetical protein